MQNAMTRGQLILPDVTALFPAAYSRINGHRVANLDELELTRLEGTGPGSWRQARLTFALAVA